MHPLPPYYDLDLLLVNGQEGGHNARSRAFAVKFLIGIKVIRTLASEAGKKIAQPCVFLPQCADGNIGANPESITTP